jgi:hypothetical protein
MEVERQGSSVRYHGPRKVYAKLSEGHMERLQDMNKKSPHTNVLKS